VVVTLIAFIYYIVAMSIACGRQKYGTIGFFGFPFYICVGRSYRRDYVVGANDVTTDSVDGGPAAGIVPK